MVWCCFINGGTQDFVSLSHCFVEDIPFYFDLYADCCMSNAM